MDLELRPAVVTGGASGIGRDLVLQLLQQGAHVAAVDVDRRRLDSTVRAARAANTAARVTGHVVDVTDEAAVVGLVGDVAQAHGSEAIHLLVDNAGVVGGGPGGAVARRDR